MSNEQQQKVVQQIGGGLGYNFPYRPEQKWEVPTLPPGVYRPRFYDNPFQGSFWVFDPAKQDNDKPIDCLDAINPMMAEITKFLHAAPRYHEFGLAHKRGYLLHGPPGCGKSSALRLLSERFVTATSGLVLLCDPSTSFDNIVETIRETEPTRPILVLVEDVDTDISEFESSLLEFLDGAKALNNFVFVATTNHIEQIPQRIRNRPSRIDRLVEMGFPSLEGRRLYLERFPITPHLRTTIAEATDQLSMAHLKEVVIGHVLLEQDLAEVVERVRSVDVGELVKEDAPNTKYTAAKLSVRQRVERAALGHGR